MPSLKTRLDARFSTGSITIVWLVRMILLLRKMESARNRLIIAFNKEKKDARNARLTTMLKTVDVNLFPRADALKWTARVCARDARIHLR